MGVSSFNFSPAPRGFFFVLTWKTPLSRGIRRQRKQQAPPNMTAMLDYFDRVSVFGRSSVALVIILGLNGALTALHSWQEWKGKDVPIWRVFGAIVGLWLPNWLGFLFFTLGLTLALWIVGLASISGWLIGPLREPCAAGALGALIGARLSDTLVSHWGLYALGYRPNPGLTSTPLYIIEAIFILLTFWKGLELAPKAAWWGFALGVGAFILVLPALRGLWMIAPSWRRDRWARWQPLPAWTRDS
jgi:hypothetical protein